MKKNVDEYQFSVKVHTLCLKSEVARLSENEIRNKPYTNDFKICGGHAHYVINPNKLYGEIQDASAFKSVIIEIADDLFLEPQEYEFERVDLAFDTYIPYEEISKINCYLVELYAFYYRIDNTYFTKGTDLEKRNVKAGARSYDLVVYNKQSESAGRNPYKTRIEFRFLRMRKNHTIDEVVDHVMYALDGMLGCIDLLSAKKLEELSSRYEIERMPDYEGRAIDLDSFVSRYADFIYSHNILKGLHDRYSTRKQYKDWLYAYRKKGNTITLYGRRDISQYIMTIKKSLRAYQIGCA